MMADTTFEHLIREAHDAPFDGWDFSYLEGRKTEISLPWDFRARVRERIVDVTSMLDVGTGGGEFLASCAPLPPRVCATEGYGPNIAVAKRRLEPLGVDVWDVTEDRENRHPPFQDGDFELVVSRHESYVPAEVWRVLQPGGWFLTQQVTGAGGWNLVEWFKGEGPLEPVGWTAALACRQLEHVGFRVTDAIEASGEYSFFDVGAVAYYLRVVPWLVEDFSAETYRERLLAMHQHIRRHGRFVVEDERFLIEAVKPV